MLGVVGRIMANFCVLVIRGYQLVVSPWLGQHCRFYPTCSAYAIEAFRQHGLWRGLCLTFVRLCKCHPWHPGGFDYVPPRRM